MRRLSQAAPAVLAAALLLAAVVSAAAQQTMGEASRRARLIVQASKLKVWTNDDIEYLKRTSIISIVGQEPPPPAAAPGAPAVPQSGTAAGEAPPAEPPANPDELPADGAYLNMTMEARAARIAELEQNIAAWEQESKELRVQQNTVTDNARWEQLLQQLDALEKNVVSARQEISDIKRTPPPPEAPPQ